MMLMMLVGDEDEDEDGMMMMIIIIIIISGIIYIYIYIIKFHRHNRTCEKNNAADQTRPGRTWLASRIRAAGPGPAARSQKTPGRLF